MNNPLISIIVPVYNGESYIARCLDSLLGQTYPNIEIIVVNDGSDDGTANILSQYERYPQIRLLYQENKGLSGARNLGLEYFEGDFACFIDIDDYVAPTYCEALYDALIENQADISICQYIFVEGEEKYFLRNDKSVEVFNSLEALGVLFEDDKIKSYAWGKLFKRELLYNFTFPMGRIFEDYASIFSLFDRSSRVVLVNDCLYYYVQYSNSLSHNLNSKKSFHFLLGIMEMYVFALKYKEKLSNWDKIVRKTAKQSLFAIKRFYLCGGEINKENEQVIKERVLLFYTNESKKIPFEYKWKIWIFLKISFLYNLYIQFKKK